MYKRPSPQETDEDVLRLQQEFHRQQAENKIKLAATVVSEKPEDDEAVVDLEDQLANTFEAIPERDIGPIVEKTAPNEPFPKLNFASSRGFPVARRRNAGVDSAQGGSSIFAQQFKRVKKNAEVSQTHKVFPSQSFVVTGMEKDLIHEENLKKMQNMSEQEILEEREKLLATMDPAIVAYLKSRRQAESEENRNPTIEKQNQAAQNMEIDEIETASEILNLPQAEKWLNFKTIETNKLAWMRQVDLPKIEKKDSYEARFDFEGWIMPYVEKQITEKSRSLYHHGEEAGRPGYTLQELFQLSRSNVIQQKIIALNTIANILSLHSTGVYDDVIDLPIEQIFFVLRFSLDDNTPAVINSCIKAMRNLFFSKIDETCLDCLMGFGFGTVQPTLAIDELEDDDRVNDQQLAETNLVKCLIRTEILTRIRYIISTVQPNTETVVYCLDLLTRLARDSHFIFMKIYNCEDLVANIIKKFASKETSEPLVQVLKFLRILACRSKTIAADFITKYNVMDSILFYLSNDQFSKNVNGLNLQIESMNLWASFAHYGLARDFFQVLQPVFINLLTYHYKSTNLEMSTTYTRQSHVSALLMLVALNNSSAFLPLLKNCTIKWFKQFMTLTEFACGKLQIISALFFCLSNFSQVAFSDELNQLVSEIFKSEIFRMVTKTMTNTSMLLNNYEVHKSSPNLKTVEAAAWYTSEHVVPILQTNSSLLFLSSLSNFIEACSNSDLKFKFLQVPSINNYLNEIRKLDKYFLSSHWFTRIESNFIMNILKIAVSIKTRIESRPFYEVAVKSLGVFTQEQKPNIEHLFRNIIFSREFYPSEILIQNLSIEQRNDSLATSLNNMDEILQVYIKVLNLQQNIPTFTTNLSLDLLQGNVIPLDWIYTPIILLYSNQQQNKANLEESEQVFTIRNCLRWILIYETYFPELATSIDPTDRFCRIVCVFLGSDSLFLIDEIHNLLGLCLKNIMRCQAEINFDKRIEGLSSFQDLYTQLLEQYQGVSYGDVLFGNFLLVPLIQKQSVRWRKILWSEYLGVVEIFNVSQDESFCSLEMFLEPPEEDVSLLKCYRRALVSDSIRKHSIFYTIAKHHVEKFAETRKIRK